MWVRRCLTQARWRIKRWCWLDFVHHCHFLSLQKSIWPWPIHRWSYQLVLLEFRFDRLCTSVKLLAVDISDRACLFWISFTPGGICAASDASLGRWLEVETVLGHLAQLFFLIFGNLFTDARIEPKCWILLQELRLAAPLILSYNLLRNHRTRGWLVLMAGGAEKLEFVASYIGRAGVFMFFCFGCEELIERLENLASTLLRLWFHIFHACIFCLIFNAVIRCKCAE